MESLNFNSQKKELHQLKQMQDKAKESCMISFRLLHSHLKQLDREEFQETKSIGAFKVLMKQFQTFINFRYCFDDFDGAMIRKRVNDRVMQSKEGKVDSSKALDAGLVVTESNETESERHVLSSRYGNDTHTDDADINSVNDKQPMAEVQLSAEHNILANEQQHSEQSESVYDTYLLEKVDRNTTPESTDMSHRGGEIDQNADAKKCQVSCPLPDPSFDNMTTEFSNQFLESKNISLKKTVAQLQKDFSRMETHFVNMELKYQNQALKDGQHGQILNETINIELEHSVAKLLAENEMLHKENEHLKQTYKDLYDSIKKTSVQTKDHADSLIVQLNCKSVENADLKAQIQEKVFANAALKNELRKLKGTSVDTKFAKPSILGKPVLQPPRNQSVVRQPNAFKSERPNFSKPRFASQVDVNNVLSKPVTPHYLPKVRESVFAKPQHVIAPGSSRNSSKESYGSNDMAHNYYLEEAKKKTQDKNRNLKPRKMPSAKTHNTPNACTPKPRSNNQTSRNWPTSKSCEETLKAMQKADHSRNPSLFSDFKHFVCSSCQKCVFNANHDACITKFLKEVNSRAKIQPNKTRNSNTPIDPTSHTQKPGRKIVKRHNFSLNKSSAVHEKTNTPRSYFRWIPTGRIFNTAGLKWVPIGKTFTSSTTKVDCELPNGSNDYITNPYKCDQTLNVSAGTLNLSAGTFCNPEKERLGAPLLKEKKSVRFSALYLQKKRNLLIRWQKRIFPHWKTYIELDEQILHCSEYLPKVHENLKLITDERVIEENPESHSGSLSSMKNLDDTYNFGDQFLYDKLTEDDQEKSKVIEESDSTIPDPSHQIVTSTPPVIAPFTEVSSTKPSSLVTPSPINTEHNNHHILSLKIYSIHLLQLRVWQRLEQEISEDKKTDHSADIILASIKYQVSYNTESEKSPKEITESKGNKERRNKIQLTPSGQLKQVDEDAIDKEVAVKVKDHKRKHDSDDEEDDDDDEGPSAGSNHALTSTGWQITDTRDDVVNSLMHMLPNNIQITDTNSFIVSKKRSSNSSKKLKGIQTLTPAEQEAADIMKALKESKKMSKRQPRTGGSNEGTGNILGVHANEPTVNSRAQVKELDPSQGFLMRKS
ncbi:hypothetical protein Tco_0535558 [Tanacetum coccineum]